MARQCARHGAVGWHGIVGAHGEEPGPHLRQQIIELLEEGGGPTLDSTSTQGHAGAVCESSGLMSTRTSSRTLPTLLKVSDFAASSCPDERTRRRTLMLRRAVILHAGRCLCMPVTDSQEAGALTHRTCCRHVIKFNSAGFELISKTKTQQKGRYPIGVLHSQHVSRTFARRSALYGFSVQCDAMPSALVSSAWHPSPGVQGLPLARRSSACRS
jgi:hypothetical protein